MSFRDDLRYSFLATETKEEGVAVLRRAWEAYMMRVKFTTGTAQIVNWAGGHPSIQFRVLVIDSYSGATRPIEIIEQCDIDHILFARPEEPHRCVVLRWVHRQFTNIFIHEASEQFLFDDKHVFDPHNDDTRLPGVIY